jgi:predicted dehydrogenase
MIAPGDSVEVWLRVTGEHGTMIATNPLAPQQGDSMIVVDLGDRVWCRPASETTTTYRHQLVAFREAIVAGTAFPTTADDGVRNMEIIDACYRAAGLDPRPSS